MPLVVKAEETPVGRLVAGHHHAAVARRDRLVDVEAVSAGIPNRPYGAALVAGAKRLRAVLDQQEFVLVGNRLQLVQPRRIAEHMHGHDGLGARRDLALHVGRVQIERAVDLRQDRNRPRIDDRRDAGNEGVSGHNDLVARTHPQPDQRHQQRRGSGVHRHGVGHADALGHFLLKFDDLGLEPRIVGAPVSVQIPRLQNLQQFLLFLFPD